MNKPFLILFAMLLSAAAGHVLAQGVPPPPPGHAGPGLQDQRGLMRDLSLEQREQMRAERRERHEAWQRMSPEERQQLRRDIRDSGQTLYPRGRHHRPD
jgi:Spy/CpxP family protein refolding chaperone